jgi:Fe-S-cluster formation regulator IscX/YfhJ
MEMDDNNTIAETVDDKGDENDPKNIDFQSNQARIFGAAQHQETWKQAVKTNPKALLWCEFISSWAWLRSD